MKIENNEDFKQLLNQANLWHWFIDEFSEECFTLNWNDDGWHVTPDTIQYRSEDMFDPHEQGYGWEFTNQEFWRTVLVHVIQSHGYEITYNGGDEEDALIIFTKIDPCQP